MTIRQTGPSDTVDRTFAANRQRLLTEQGYTYRIHDATDLHRP